MRRWRGTCGTLDGQTSGSEPVLGIEREEVHVVPDAKLLVERPTLGEGLVTGVLQTCEVTASWREYLTVTTGTRWNLTVSRWSN